MPGCTEEHARFCSQCTTARLYNSIHCQDCGEGRPSAATTTGTPAWTCCGVTYKGGSECPKCLTPKPGGTVLTTERQP